jgi:hypothetical protein
LPRYTFTTSSTSCSTQASARSLANTDHTQGGHEPIDSNGSGRPGTSTCTQPETVMRARSHARHGHCCSLCTRDAERRPICVVCWTCCSSACRYDDAIFAVTSALPARRSLHTFARTDGPSAGCRLFTSTCLGQNDRFSQTSESSTWNTSTSILRRRATGGGDSPPRPGGAPRGGDGEVPPQVYPESSPLGFRSAHQCTLQK